MKNLLRLLSTILLASLCVLPSCAQPALKMRTYTMADGLLSNTITMLATGNKGMVWIGTWNGLCNYDGYRFNSFVAPMGAGHMLPSNRLQFITPDMNGNVWVAPVGRSLFLLDSKRGQYIDYSGRLDSLGLNGFTVRGMLSLGNGAVWILGSEGKNLRVQDGRHEVVPTSNAKKELCGNVLLTDDGAEWLVGERTIRRKDRDSPIRMPQGVRRITAARTMPGNRLAVATDRGLFVHDIHKKTTEKILDTYLENIYCDARGRLWSTLGNGTAIMIEATQKPQTRTLTCSIPGSWPKLVSQSALVHEDINGNVWVLLQGKTLCRYDESAKELLPINLRDISSEIPDKVKLERIFTDIHKNLWFSNLFKLYKLSFSNHIFHYTPVAPGEETRALLVDGKGRCLAGTRNGHIVVMDGKGKRIGYLTAKGGISATPATFSSKGIYALYEDRHKRLWVGTRGDGLYLLDADGEGFRLRHHFLKDRDYNGSRPCGDDYYDIHCDITGRIWFATYPTGIMYFDETAERFVSARNCKALRLPEGDVNKIRRIITAADGNLIFSTADGILTLSPKFRKPEDIRIFRSSYIYDNKSSLMTRDVMQTLQCRKSGNVYVATLGGGVQSMKPGSLLRDSIQFKEVAMPVLNTGTIRGMIEDNGGKIWIAGENYVGRLTPDGNDTRLYTSVDWGHDLEFCEAKLIYDKRNNRIIMGTVGGIVTFCPDDIRQATYSPPIVFTGIQYQGDESITPFIGNDGVTLPVDRHNAVIYFSALDYRDNSKIRYAYRIKELDGQWTFVGKEHCASLSNLPSGHYTLEVRSTNNECTWMDNNAMLSIYVEPTFWQTPWAWILYLAAGGMLAYLAIYLIWLQKAHRMEKKMKERQLRFFTDISHQLRTPLTIISGPVTEVLNTEKLSEKGSALMKAVENNAKKMLSIVDKTLDLRTLQLLNEEIQDATVTDGIGNEESSATDRITASPVTVIDDLTILIVEDNDELRYFLRTTLATHYNIIEAENGKTGLRLAAEHQPDFIITDIMMPEMDGITMIRHIKSDESICHIPIIILSARTAEVYRIEGLKEGADDYITKPFSMSYLQVRVESIVRQRRMLQEEWRKRLLPDQTPQNADDIQMTETKDKSRTNATGTNGQTAGADNELSELDTRFVQALTEYIQKNISNSDLRIDDIAYAMNVSRTVLYGKVKSIYGVSPNDVVRNLRIAYACKLLREEFGKSVTEIAYAAGYNEPRYFARCFKQSMGMSPMEYRKGK